MRRHANPAVKADRFVEVAPDRFTRMWLCSAQQLRAGIALAEQRAKNDPKGLLPLAHQGERANVEELRAELAKRPVSATGRW